MEEIKIQNLNIWGDDKHKETLAQICEICQKAIAIDLEMSADRNKFYPPKGTKTQRQGILSVAGKVIDINTIQVSYMLIQDIKNIRIASVSMLKALSEINDKTRILPPVEEAPGLFSLYAEVKVEATPLGPSRLNVFIEELKKVDAFARFLQNELSINLNDPDIIKLYHEQYHGFEETLSPVYPWQLTDACDSAFLYWAHETYDLLSSAASLAIAAPFPVMIPFALAVLASISREHNGKSIGQLIPPAINAKGLVELTRNAPGIVSVPAIRISLGTSPYELGSEMRALLVSLSESNTPAIFTGSHGELQAVFHGGQGGYNDPLSPVLCHIPDISLQPLTRFVIQSAGQKLGGLPKIAEKELEEKVIHGLKDMEITEQRRLLPLVANRIIKSCLDGKDMPKKEVSSFATKLSGVSESLSGLVSKPRAMRSPNVQKLLTEVLTDPGLLSFFQEHLMAQDFALEQLVSRLRMETLTRAGHQPIRYCAQGTPATGKSESASLLAQKLGIPYVNIDASSMPDYHTAASQLLGSGRGIVGSHQAGRLEQVAKHHSGAVVEVSDLDHAPSSVRSPLADLFLQVLETGEAQSATGAMFSCANLIFAFTMNLPGGMDEDIRKGIGFNNIPSQGDVRKRVIAEIKGMLSSAFLSRVGTPIIFEPLDGEALAAIIERAIKRAIIVAAERLHCPIQNVVLESGLGARVISSLPQNIHSFGARALLEKGRSMAAEALTAKWLRDRSFAGKSLFISVDSNSRIVVNTHGSPGHHE
ncbi:ATP-dependent Clp protease ATP-binding subunit [bacterium]|nr:ATP-dependent Clp protease ATP-binding subunit [bacterium]